MSFLSIEVLFFTHHFFKASSKLLRLRHENERDRHRACWTLPLVMRRRKTKDDIHGRFRHKREYRSLQVFYRIFRNLLEETDLVGIFSNRSKNFSNLSLIKTLLGSLRKQR